MRPCCCTASLLPFHLCYSSQHLCCISAAPPIASPSISAPSLLLLPAGHRMSSQLALDMQCRPCSVLNAIKTGLNFLGWMFTLPLQMLLAILYHLVCLPCGNAQLPSYGNELGRSSSSNKPFSNFVDLPSQRLKASTAMQNMGEEVGGIPIFFPFF